MTLAMAEGQTHRGKFPRKGQYPTWDQAWEDYTKALGVFVAEWNILHDELCSLFAACIGAHSYEMAYAIWHSVPSDRTQRALLRAAVTKGDEDPQFGHYKFPPELREEIVWILNQVDKISDPRNDAAHSPVYTVTFEDKTTFIFPHSKTNNPRSAGLDKRISEHSSASKLFTSLGKRCDALRAFTERVTYCVEQWPEPLPPRPLTNDN